jgi:hypothetical protein
MCCEHRHRRIEPIPLSDHAVVVCMDCGMYWDLYDEPLPTPEGRAGCGSPAMPTVDDEDIE